MDRRTFFGTLVAAIAARKIPVELEPIKLAPIYPSTKEAYFAYRYCLGYKITRELLEDDMYLIQSKIAETHAKHFRNQIEDEILRRG